jgi:hypothetical protein
MIAQAERMLLACIGFFLCREGQIAEAETIFDGLHTSAPDKDGPVVGLALCCIIKGECDEAVKMLDELLDAGSPLTIQMSLYKLVALGMGGRLSEAKALRECMEAKGMTQALATADSLLAELAKIKG